MNAPAEKRRLGRFVFPFNALSVGQAILVADTGGWSGAACCAVRLARKSGARLAVTRSDVDGVLGVVIRRVG